MTLGEKIRYLREIEGSLRGLERPLTQLEVVDSIRKDLGARLSQSYLSQIENGTRPHLTNKSRSLIAKFFRVHPGYLVDDPEGYHVDLQTSKLRTQENDFDVWLYQGAERFAKDPKLANALLSLAKQEDSRHSMLLLGEILSNEGLPQRLWDALKGTGNGKSKERRNAERRK